MINHSGPISGVACSKSYVATAGYDNKVILWDRKSKMSLQRGLHDHLANRCEFSPDETLLISASSDYTARLWKLPEMHLAAVFTGHEDDVECARFSPCGRFIATTCQDSKIRIFNLSGSLERELIGHEASVYTCAWSHDGRTLVSSSDDGTIREWNSQTGECVRLLDLGDVQTDAVAITRDGIVYAGNDSGELIRIENNNVIHLRVHDAGIKNIAIDSRENLLLSLSYDKTLGIIDISKDPRLVKKMIVPSLIWARSAAFIDQNNIAFATFGSSYATLNLDSECWNFENVENTKGLNSVYAKDGKVFSVGDAGVVKVHEGHRIEKLSSTGSLCNFITQFHDLLVCGGHMGIVYNAKTGAPLFELKCPINRAIQSQDQLALALYTGELAFVKKTPEQKYEVTGLYKVLKNAVKDISVSGRLLFCVGAAGDACFFDTDARTVIRYIEEAHGAIINSSTFVSGNVFATVGRDRMLKLWNPSGMLTSIESPHDHSVKCVSASRDGNFIACGSYDGKVAIYSLETQRWQKVFRASSSGLSSLHFGLNSFFASSYDGKIYEFTA